LFVLAPAASGKGNLLFCRSLVKPIHSTLMNASKIERQEFHQANADSNGKKQPNQDYTEPTMKMLFIPANISSTGFFQLLNDNDGRGLLFETEGDTLAYAFKQDYGNYSDGFRKAYQHEPITYYRKTNREYCELEKPKLSCVLSGTPEQIKTLTPSAENGLFSRFVFYFFKSSPKWKNVFEKRSGLYLEAQFEEFGNEFFRMYQSYETHANTTFSFTDKQHEDFQKFFTQRILYYDNIQDPAFIASVFRMGVVHFRIAMVLTALRYMEDGNLEEYVFCSEEDFYNALEIVETLFKHSNHVFDFLPKKVSGVIPKNLKEKFLETLPKKFTRKSYLDAAESLGINAKTADGYVCVWVKKQFVFRQMNGQYEKAL
jgi:hypothetical protein